MKSQSILLLLATLAVLARDVACEKNGNKNKKNVIFFYLLTLT